MEFHKGQRILGLDPGSQIAGYAIIEAKRYGACLPQDFEPVCVNTIRCNGGESKIAFLATLHQALLELMTRHKPHHIVIERAFVGLNAHAALRLGEVRGAMLAVSYMHTKHVWELTPAQIKKTITGNGRSDKEAIRKSLVLLIGFRDHHLPFDASDALACALALGINTNLGVSAQIKKGNSSMAAVAKNYLSQQKTGSPPQKRPTIPR